MDEKKNEMIKPSWQIKAITKVALFLMRLFAESQNMSFIWASPARSAVERLNQDLSEILEMKTKADNSDFEKYYKSEKEGGRKEL